MPEGKDALVREEQASEASGLPVVLQGIRRAATPLGISAESI